MVRHNPGLSVADVAVDALTAEDWSRWDGFVAANPTLASPFFASAFTRIAGRIVPGARMAVLSSGGSIVGYFPFQRRANTVLPIAAPLNDCHGVVAAPGLVLNLDALRRGLGAGRLILTSCVAPVEGANALTNVAAVLPEAGFEAWFAERRAAFPKFFKDKARARRGLEADVGTLRVELGNRDPKVLDWLIATKREQYARTGLHDVFACGWTHALLKALMTEAVPGFGGSMAVLWGGDRVVACEYSLLGGAHMHFWFPVYDPTVARCSPGIILTLETMRMAAADGFRVFDFGLSGPAYKKYFCNHETTVWEQYLEAPDTLAHAEKAAFGLLKLAAGGRATALRQSWQRRWATIKACETTFGRRLQGAGEAVVSRLRRSAGEATQAAALRVTSL